MSAANTNNTNAIFTSASLRSAARPGLRTSKEFSMMERWVAQVQKEKAAEGDDPLLNDVRAILHMGSVDELRKLQTHVASTAWQFEE